MKKEDLEVLENRGFYFTQTSSHYEAARMKGPCTVILYNSGKVLVQGKEEIVKEIMEELGLKKKKEKSKEENIDLRGTIIGSDETLKGDSFGGLIVVGFRANDSEREKILNMGVKDSKKITDDKILMLAKRLEEHYADNICVIELLPFEYNAFTKDKSVTILLNELHQKVNEELATETSTHVVDKYPGCKTGVIIEPRAESKFPEVAAASIIARARAIRQFQRLSEKAGFYIPKGSTHVLAALKKIKSKALDPEKYAKMNFSNVRKLFP